MYILMQYSDNCLKLCGTLRQYRTDISAVNNNCQIVDFGERLILLINKRRMCLLIDFGY